MILESLVFEATRASKDDSQRRNSISSPSNTFGVSLGNLWRDSASKITLLLSYSCLFSGTDVGVWGICSLPGTKICCWSGAERMLFCGGVKGGAL